MEGDGWSALFASAFNQSRNPMVLADAERRIVDVNAAFVQLVGRPRGDLVGRRPHTLVAGGPLATPSEWRDALTQRRFPGGATLLHAAGSESARQGAGGCGTAPGRRGAP